MKNFKADIKYIIFHGINSKYNTKQNNRKEKVT